MFFSLTTTVFIQLTSVRIQDSFHFRYLKLLADTRDLADTRTPPKVGGMKTSEAILPGFPKISKFVGAFLGGEMEFTQLFVRLVDFIDYCKRSGTLINKPGFHVTHADFSGLHFFFAFETIDL